MDLVIIKEGDYTGNIFFDVLDVVGETKLDGRGEGIASRHRMDIKMRIVKNTSSVDPDMHLALTHYAVDIDSGEFPDGAVRGIDAHLMKKILDEGYEFVLFASPTEDRYMIPEHQLLQEAAYVVRDTEGHLVDYVSKKRLITDEELIEADGVSVYKQCVVFASMIKPTKFSMYYLISNPSVIGVADGIDKIDADHNMVYRKITPQDGTIKESLVGPVIGPNVEVILDNHIFASSDDMFSIDLFNSQGGIIGRYKEHLDFPSLSATVETNLEVRELRDYKFAFRPPAVVGAVGYIRIKMDLNEMFYENVHNNEKLVYEYIVHRS